MDRKKGNSNNVYFGEKLQKIIEKYNKSQNAEIRQKLFAQHIESAFRRIATSLVNKYQLPSRLQNYHTIVQSTISTMVQKMPGFDSSKGKAFTYFTIVSRNYILSQLDKGIKHNQRFRSINRTNDEGVQINLLENCSLSNWHQQQQKQYISQLMQQTINRLAEVIQKQYIPSLKKESQKKIAYAVLQLINDIDLISNFNRKAIIIYITEMTGGKLATIMRILKNIGKYYYEIKEDVIENDLQLSLYEY